VVQGRPYNNGRPTASRTGICLSNGTIFSDLKRPITEISTSRHYLTLNVAETVQDTDIVPMKY